MTIRCRICDAECNARLCDPCIAAALASESRRDHRGSFADRVPRRPCVWLPEPMFERLRGLAQAQGVPMRRALEMALAPVLNLHSVRGRR